MQRITLVTVVVAAVVFAATTAASSDRTARGRLLVQRYCAGCHSVSRSGSSPNPAAPPFRDLNRRYRIDELGEAPSRKASLTRPSGHARVLVSAGRCEGAGPGPSEEHPDIAASLRARGAPRRVGAFPLFRPGLRGYHYEVEGARDASIWWRTDYGGRRDAPRMRSMNWRIPRSWRLQRPGARLSRGRSRDLQGPALQRAAPGPGPLRPLRPARRLDRACRGRRLWRARYPVRPGTWRASHLAGRPLALDEPDLLRRLPLPERLDARAAATPSGR